MVTDFSHGLDPEVVRFDIDRQRTARTRNFEWWFGVHGGTAGGHVAVVWGEAPGKLRSLTAPRPPALPSRFHQVCVAESMLTARVARSQLNFAFIKS